MSEVLTLIAKESIEISNTDRDADDDDAEDDQVNGDY